MNNPLPFLAWKFRRVLASWHRALAAKIGGRKALPLGYWTRARTVLSVFSPSGCSLMPVPRPEVSGACVEVAELRDVFSRCMIGDWALDPDSIGLLWESLQEDRPNSILEFGSGKTTLMLARYAESRRPERVTVVSLEQGVTARAATERLLEESGLGGLVTVLTVPIDDSGFYQVAPDQVAVALAGSQPEWLLIDGPHGPAGCRLDTLLRFGALCAPASHWYLDDAFRDGEMEALIRWNRTPGLRVDGIYPVGQGLATGRIVAPASLIGQACAAPR